jgi:hypothetical protein
MDTSRYDLNAKKFLFRIREEKETNEYNVTLKCRHHDRYVSALYDLSSPIKNMKTKFEEDIISPFVSKFLFQLNSKKSENQRSIQLENSNRCLLN